MRLTSERIDAIRMAAYAALGLTFAATGLWVLATRSVPPFPPWAYAGIGLGVAAILFGVAAAAPRAALEASYDEGSSLAWLRAQAFGCWVGVAAFVVPGNGSQLAGLPAGVAFLGASLLTASAPFAHSATGEWRRGRG